MLLAQYVIASLIAITVPLLIMASVLLLGWAERRGAAFIQDRLGPNRVTFFGLRNAGLLQMVADGVKLLFKEDFIPAAAHRTFFALAPFLITATALCTFAVIPFGDVLKLNVGAEQPLVVHLQVANLNVGLLFIFAIASLSVYGIVLAGWASNNKYTLLGGLRSSAQMISYEIAMGLSVIGALMVYESIRLNDIAQMQGELLWGFLPKWGIVVQPLGFLLFLVAGFAETNRIPFDLPEAETELVTGYHTEYGSLKFSMFMMAEYIAMVTTAGIIVSLFFGGWQLPWLPTATLAGWVGPWLTALLQIGAFLLKMAFFLWLFIWVRWTLPRFRYDQLMRLGWKVMLPLALFNIFITGLVIILK